MIKLTDEVSLEDFKKYRNKLNESIGKKYNSLAPPSVFQKNQQLFLKSIQNPESIDIEREPNRILELKRQKNPKDLHFYPLEIDWMTISCPLRGLKISDDRPEKFTTAAEISNLLNLDSDNIETREYKEGNIKLIDKPSGILIEVYSWGCRVQFQGRFFDQKEFFEVAPFLSGFIIKLDSLTKNYQTHPPRITRIDINRDIAGGGGYFRYGNPQSLDKNILTFEKMNTASYSYQSFSKTNFTGWRSGSRRSVIRYYSKEDELKTHGKDYKFDLPNVWRLEIQCSTAESFACKSATALLYLNPSLNAICQIVSEIFFDSHFISLNLKEDFMFGNDFENDSTLWSKRSCLFYLSLIRYGDRRGVPDFEIYNQLSHYPKPPSPSTVVKDEAA
ncbi:MAG: hypothetical protein HN482_09155 [Bdellovibrionales bacterium]|jgi:hypothetical protein|nr:hypothetical protein [Bdellovibrionales bacterium]MBT7670538.1 hypothetical protein [Bdellovibrionales bacterium]